MGYKSGIAQNYCTVDGGPKGWFPFCVSKLPHQIRGGITWTTLTESFGPLTPKDKGSKHKGTPPLALPLQDIHPSDLDFTELRTGEKDCCNSRSGS